METLRELLPFAIRGSLLLLAFAIGLDSTFSDATHVLRRPKLLLRSVVAINIVVPAFAVFIAALFPLTHMTKIAIVLMAVSPLPIFAPGKEIKLGGHKPYVYGLLVAESILSIAIVPLTVALISAAFPADASISPLKVAETVLVTVLLPIGIGMIFHKFVPRLAEKAAHMISKIAIVLLMIGLTPILIAAWPAILGHVGNGSVLAFAAVVAIGLAAGHFLGGPSIEDRTSLAISSALRHPGIAIMIANENFPDPRARAAILLLLIIGMAATVPYQIWAKRHHQNKTIPDRRI